MIKRLFDELKDLFNYIFNRRHKRLSGLVVEYQDYGIKSVEDPNFTVMIQEVVHDVLERKKIVIFPVRDVKMYAYRKGNGVEIDSYKGTISAPGLDTN
jgi:hypothetical protein